MPTRQRTQRPPIDLAAELERAVERNEFGLEYQPIIDLGSGSIAVTEIASRSPSLTAIPDNCRIHVDRRLTIGD